MKSVYVVRHADWNLVDDALTAESREAAMKKRSQFPPFTHVVSSPFERCKQTAELLSQKPAEVSELASVPQAPERFLSYIQEQRKVHPLGVAGVLFEIPQVKPALEEAGRKLISLIKEVLLKLNDDGSALVISHDGTMLAAERIIRNQSLEAPLDHTYSELQGFKVDQDLNLSELEK